MILNLSVMNVRYTPGALRSDRKTNSTTKNPPSNTEMITMNTISTNRVRAMLESVAGKQPQSIR